MRNLGKSFFAFLLALNLFSVPAASGSGGVVVAWGDDQYGQTDVPPHLTDAVAISAGVLRGLALRSDGSVMEWGLDHQGGTNIPPGLTNIVAISAGGNCLALRADGTVVLWDDHWWIDELTTAASLTDVKAVAAGLYHDLALRRDGTVVAWGDNLYGQTNVPVGLSNVIAIAAGYFHSLSLKADGTVVAWGAGTNDFIDSNSWQFRQSIVPPGLSNVVAIAADVAGSVALKSDGTVVCWGDAYVPPWLAIRSDIIMACRGLVQTRSGQVLTTSSVDPTDTPVKSSCVKAISAGSRLYLAIVDPNGPRITGQPLSVFRYTGYSCEFSVVVGGVGPFSYQWELDGIDLPGETNSVLALASVQSSDAGAYSVVVSNAFGVLTSVPAALTTADAPPRIVVQPESQPLLRGQTVVFGVTAEGSGPLQYQWCFNNTNLVGETASTLRFAVAQTTNAGSYTVVITNAFGAVTSAPVLLYLPAEYTFSAPAGPLLWDFGQAANGTWHGGQVSGNGSAVTMRTRVSDGYWESYSWPVGGIWVETTCTRKETLNPVDRVRTGIETCQTKRFKINEFILYTRKLLSTTVSQSPVSDPLPAEMDGHWTLKLQIVPTGNRLSGLATITADRGRVFNLKLTGLYSSKTGQSKMVLTGSGPDKGASLQLVSMGPDMELRSMRGRVGGQLIRFSAADRR
jgi:hypothetical protein